MDQDNIEVDSFLFPHEVTDTYALVGMYVRAEMVLEDIEHFEATIDPELRANGDDVTALKKYLEEWMGTAEEYLPHWYHVLIDPDYDAI